jgi:hypothetical protein
MRRLAVLAAVALAALGIVPTASPFGTIVPAENASCGGILAAAANPNAAYVIHNLGKPAAEEQGVTFGVIQSGAAREHPGLGGVEGLEACIPDFGD